MRKQREDRPALCPYCGLRPGITKDHVIPQSLFPKPLPNGINLPTFRACAKCNNVRKSGDDVFLRDFLITDMHCSDHPAAQALLNGEMGRAMRSNRSEFARAAVPKGRPVPLFTSTGLYAGTCYTAPLDGERINRIFATITRGLYFKVLRRLLPADTQFEVRRQDPRYIGELLNLVQPPDAWCRPPSLGDVFTCVYAIGPYEKAQSLWVMQFYGSMYISVFESAPVGTVRQSKEALKPAEVLTAYAGSRLRAKARRKNAAFVRQGEWFFLPVPGFAVDEKLVLTNEPLRRGNGGKPHWAAFCYRTGGETVYVCYRYPNGVTEVQYQEIVTGNPTTKGWGWRTMRRNPGVYVKGRIRHADHATIALHGWHRVLMNTEGQSKAMRNVAFLD